MRETPTGSSRIHLQRRPGDARNLSWQHRHRVVKEARGSSVCSGRRALPQPDKPSPDHLAHKSQAPGLCLVPQPPVRDPTGAAVGCGFGLVEREFAEATPSPTLPVSDHGVYDHSIKGAGIYWVTANCQGGAG